MARSRRELGAVAALIAGMGLLGLVALNSSSLAPSPGGPPRALAHRGVHQTFPPEGIENDTCTAQRIRPPTHGLLENTLPSMAAAFEAGADVVELDVHATRDGQLVVLHDATLECRTDGKGAPEDHSLAELRGLDLGYGYTADGGQTWPLRGQGRDLVVTLPEVFERFPGRAFLIDIKRGTVEDGALVAEALARLPPADLERQRVYGGAAAVEVVTRRHPGLRSVDRGRLKSCLLGYAAGGWAGWVPGACEGLMVMVPVDYAPWLWGFPRRLEARMSAVGAEVVLVGHYQGAHVTGIDDVETLGGVPPDFGGWVWTNRVEVVGPAMNQRGGGGSAR